MTCDVEINELQKGLSIPFRFYNFELVVGTNKLGGFTKSRIPAFLEKLRRSGHGVLTFINDKPGRGK